MQKRWVYFADCRAPDNGIHLHFKRVQTYANREYEKYRAGEMKGMNAFYMRKMETRLEKKTHVLFPYRCVRRTLIHTYKHSHTYEIQFFINSHTQNMKVHIYTF